MDARWSKKLRVAEQSGARRYLAALIAHSGDSWFWIIGMVVVWLLGDWDIRIWVFHLTGATVITAFFVMALKLIIRRQRPEGEWGAIYRNTDPHSFPSGHAARAFLLAILVIALGPTWLALILIPWAPLVGLSRVAMGVHYLSDIFAGGLLGLFIGTLWILFIL